MFQFNTLNNIPPATICTVFNQAFSDYIVPVQLNMSLLGQKMQGENISLAHSIGVFDNMYLVGLILHGAADWSQPQQLYNGGTGVIPSYRGQRLVQQLYEHFTPAFKQQGVKQLLLEVISTNTPALKAYQHCGFRQTRLFHCYKGMPAPWKPIPQKDLMPLSASARPTLIIRSELYDNIKPDWPLLETFASQQPSWGNSRATIQREGIDTTTWLAYEEDMLVGYISIHRATKRIRQMGVHPDHRRKGIGSALLQHAVNEHQGPFSFINITEENKGLREFLLKSGFTTTVQQYEMVLEL